MKFQDIAITKTILASELPNQFIGTVETIEEKEKEVKAGNIITNLKLTVIVEKMKLITGEMSEQYKGYRTHISYGIPKKSTAGDTGQFAILVNALTPIGITSTDMMKGKTFTFQRKELQGQIKGNPRHYPIELITKK